ncbi:hypothetical protein KFE94_07960 [bacterium SCSIO 12643]|nr:hypothetical protein KFE94_07960 [bacterium SCSIO 12643]
MERDNEWKGDGNSYNTEYRINDPRLGKWLSVDLLVFSYPNMSPFIYAANSPTLYIDENGEGPVHAMQKMLAQIISGTVAIEITGEVSIGRAYTGAIGKAVDQNGNVMLYYSHTTPFGMSIPGMTAGAKFSLYGGVEKVQDLQGTAFSFGLSGGVPLGPTPFGIGGGIDAEFNPADLVGVSFSGMVDIGIPVWAGFTADVNTTKSFAFFTAAEYKVLLEYGDKVWSKAKSEADRLTKEVNEGLRGNQTVGRWEAGMGDSDYKMEFSLMEDGSYQAIFIGTLYFKGQNGSTDTSTQIRIETGLFFNKDENGNFVSKN